MERGGNLNIKYDAGPRGQSKRGLRPAKLAPHSPAKRRRAHSGSIPSMRTALRTWA